MTSLLSSRRAKRKTPTSSDDPHIASDPTTDPQRRAWLASANEVGCAFPIQNLPFGAFALAEEERGRIGIAIGDRVLDLLVALQTGLLDELAPSLRAACAASDLNPLMALERPRWRELREWASSALSQLSQRADIEPCLRSQAEVTMLLPATVGDYSDFYASLHHATNVGRLFRPDNPLPPNYKHLPIGYHGRGSSLVPSGTRVRRPSGQRLTAEAHDPTFGPSLLLDYELEVGCFVGGAENPLGTPVPIRAAAERLFGLCLLNDWSARDLQAWEYQPLGPFLGKSFATSLSPWVITLEALAPFRCPASSRPPQDPELLPYLRDGSSAPGFDVTVEATLTTAQMRSEGLAPFRLSRGNLRAMYWTFAQMLTHHASNGCNLRPGDLLGSGTVSGPTVDSRGCLLEITRRGAAPLVLPNGEVRAMLEDGDEVALQAWCEAPEKVRIGFGTCRGEVLPALS